MSLLTLITDFLFPKNPKVISLETLSAGKLLELLPPPENLKSERTIALFDYKNKLVKEIVWEVKYNGNRILADKLGEILYDTVVAELGERNIFEKTESVLLIPMPISDRRRFERGWNQAELLTKALKARDNASQFKYLPGQLVKIIHTESQTKTSGKKERLGNLHQSMKVLNPLSVKDRYIVIVDDVTTTGATFREAERALKEAGARKVLCFAIAH